MTAKRLNISLDLLKATALFVSNEETRYYLNGVCIQATKKGDIVYVATDGHRMFVAPGKSERGEDKDVFVGEIIIPRDVISGIKLPTGRSAPNALEAVLVVGDKGRCTIEFGLGASVGFTAIDGTFPDWRRVISTSTSGVVGHFNTAYLDSFRKAGKLLGHEMPTVLHNGLADQAVIRWSGFDGFGILMPSRDYAIPATVLPAWVGPSEAPGAQDDPSNNNQLAVCTGPETEKEDAA